MTDGSTPTDPPTNRRTKGFIFKNVTKTFCSWSTWQNIWAWQQIQFSKSWLNRRWIKSLWLIWQENQRACIRSTGCVILLLSPVSLYTLLHKISIHQALESARNFLNKGTYLNQYSRIVLFTNSSKIPIDHWLTINKKNQRLSEFLIQAES